MVAGRVRQVFVLYSNNCMGIGLGDSTLVVLDEWLSLASGHLIQVVVWTGLTTYFSYQCKQPF